jgi:putative ABC transport system permease protein
MIIGVMAVISVLSIGEGAKASVEGRIRALGSNLLTVRPARNRGGPVVNGTAPTLVRADADAIEDIEGVTGVSAQTAGSAQIKFRENNMSATVYGVTAPYLSISNLDVAQGIGFSEADDTERRRFAVIGWDVAASLFEGVSAIGERIQIQGQGFTVIGVLEEKGDVGFASPDDTVMVPLSVHQGSLFGSDTISSISVQLASEDVSDSVQARVEELLRLRHRLRSGADDDFEVQSQTEMLETMNEVTGTFTALLGAVAAVSLVVGGIGIMNIMLVSVRERTREIGVRLAVGALRRDILRQFLVEAVVVSIFGGAIGIAFGWLASLIIGHFGGWEASVPTYAYVLALSVSIAIGVIFGVGPARRASRLDPVEALRQE